MRFLLENSNGLDCGRKRCRISSQHFEHFKRLVPSRKELPIGEPGVGFVGPVTFTTVSTVVDIEIIVLK